jgi:hypothetical protein
VKWLTATRNLTVKRTKKLIVKLLISSLYTGQTTSLLSWINFQCKLRKLNKSQKQCCTLKSIELYFLIDSKLYSWGPYKIWFMFFQANCLNEELSVGGVRYILGAGTIQTTLNDCLWMTPPVEWPRSWMTQLLNDTALEWHSSWMTPLMHCTAHHVQEPCLLRTQKFSIVTGSLYQMTSTSGPKNLGVFKYHTSLTLFYNATDTDYQALYRVTRLRQIL